MSVKIAQIKKVYNKEDLERKYFFEYPSTCIQYPIGLLTNRPKFFPENNYKFVSKLSDGSASKLYKAINKKTNKTVIIKKIPKYENWRTELNILQKIKGLSKRLIQCVDYFESFNYTYIITQFYPDFDLFEHIIINVPYDYENGRRLIYEMMLCIKDCHDNGIAHLDIKFENFMVNNNKNYPLTLIDFGHAEYVLEEHKDKLVYLDASYGTSYYLCPEGFDYYYSMKSDIWSLGVCVFLIFSGEFPFYGDSDDEYMEYVNKHKITKFETKLSSSDHKIVKNFIDLCLDYNPKTRPDIYALFEHPLVRDLSMPDVVPTLD